jgi:ribose 5-phosphate isomerase RpiB
MNQDRAVSIFGRSAGACLVANKAVGVFGHALAWERVKTFLAAEFSRAERHRRRLAKVAELESGGART